MKISLLLATAACALFASSPASAQTVVRETTTVQPTEVVGTVTEFVPDAIAVRTTETSAPIRYSFTESTEYVDEAGVPVSREIVKTGVPVTIRYVTEGERRIVNRVIVRKAVPAATTTTRTTTTVVREKDDDDDDDDNDD